MFTKELKYLCDSIALIESETDRWNWGNAEEDEPAFMVYLGFQSKQDAIDWKDSLIRFYRCEEISIRPAKRMSGFNWELKARGLQRYTDSHAWGLDWLIDTYHLRKAFDPNWNKPEREREPIALPIAC